MTTGARDLDDHIVVNARELRDGLYRASRTGGAAHGEASSVATATVFAAGQLGVDIERFVQTLERGELPLFGLPLVLRVQAELQPVAVPDGGTVSDVLYFVVEALRTGHVVQIGTENGRTVSVPCLLYTSPSPRDATLSRMPSSA